MRSHDRAFECKKGLRIEIMRWMFYWIKNRIFVALVWPKISFVRSFVSFEGEKQLKKWLHIVPIGKKENCIKMLIMASVNSRRFCRRVYRRFCSIFFRRFSSRFCRWFCRRFCCTFCCTFCRRVYQNFAVDFAVHFAVDFGTIVTFTN